MLSIIDATMGFNGTKLFEAVNLTVPGGEVLLLSAPSGVGKSTLLHWICGTSPLELNATGRVSLDGEDLTHLPAEQRGVGIIFQDALLFPHLTVWENLAFGMKSGGMKAGGGRGERRRLALEALEENGLGGLGDRDPLSLSGGQKARVSLLRCLMASPRALLLDEPFSGLDDEARNDFAHLVLDRVLENSLPTIIVSHDPRDEAWATLPVVKLKATVTF